MSSSSAVVVAVAAACVATSLGRAGLLLFLFLSSLSLWTASEMVGFFALRILCLFY
jgi:hypothetical protein